MLGRKNREQFDLFVAGSLEQLIPKDHVLFRVNRVLDLGWLREEVANCYSEERDCFVLRRIFLGEVGRKSPHFIHGFRKAL